MKVLEEYIIRYTNIRIQRIKHNECFYRVLRGEKVIQECLSKDNAYAKALENSQLLTEMD